MGHLPVRNVDTVGYRSLFCMPPNGFNTLSVSDECIEKIVDVKERYDCDSLAAAVEHATDVATGRHGANVPADIPADAERDADGEAVIPEGA